MTGRICGICPFLPGCAYQRFHPKKHSKKLHEPHQCIHFIEMMRKKQATRKEIREEKEKDEL